MARHLNISTKRLQIDKANATILTIVAISAFVVTFSLVASRALLSKRSYQAKIISEKKKAAKQLKDNIKAADGLVTSYKQFVGTPENVLGGNSSGQGEKDGDNAKVILDALPSKYDFPALTTSIEKILAERNYQLQSITGSDDEVAQGAKQSSPTPVPVEIPFQLVVGTNYDSVHGLLQTLERSIRPFQIQTMSLSGSSGTMQLNISAKTFYQPEKNLTITTKVVK